MKGQRALFSSLRSDWNTPIALYKQLDKEFAFNDDPCHKDSVWDGLSVEWGTRVFCNPPYCRQIGRWIAKAYEEHKKGKLVVLLIPSRTDTSWWHDYVMKAQEIRFLRGRLCFDDGKGRATFPSAVVIFRGKH